MPSPVWWKSCYTPKLDSALNESCRLITGCIKPTKTDQLYLLAGIAPPQVRRQARAEAERTKQIHDPRHPIYGQTLPKQRLKSRKNFVATTKPLEKSQPKRRIDLWQDFLSKNDQDLSMGLKPEEALPPGAELNWRTWKSLNRLRTLTGRSKENLIKWGFPTDTTLCSCGQTQTMSHLLECPNLQAECTKDNLAVCNNTAITHAQHWSHI